MSNTLSHYDKMDDFVCIFICLSFLNPYYNTIYGQRNFSNPALINIAPCSCDLTTNKCDVTCCCDVDCLPSDLALMPSCAANTSQVISKWDCKNENSSKTYDYFPFVCYEFSNNELVGNYYLTTNLTFATVTSDLNGLQDTFKNYYPELFEVVQSAPTADQTVFCNSSQTFVLPGLLAGFQCIDSLPVKFLENRDVQCLRNVLTSSCNTTLDPVNLCDTLYSDGNFTNISFYVRANISSVSTSRSDTEEYCFYPPLNLTPPTYMTILDYCDGRYPLNRTQRYYYFCNATTSCINSVRNFSCPIRTDYAYSVLSPDQFNAIPLTTDDVTKMGFSSESLATISANYICSTYSITEIFYKLNFDGNKIENASAYLTVNPVTTIGTQRVSVEWIDTSSTSGSSSGSNGLCIDASRHSIRFKESVSSYCAVQLYRKTIVENCHNLKLNMYSYLNIQYAPASYVVGSPSNTSFIKIRYTNSDWQFQCGTCSNTTTQRFLVTFQVDFVDVTRQYFGINTVSPSDLTANDDYIQHLLWLVTPEYTGEEGSRKYTITLILIYIAITIAVIHIVIFGCLAGLVISELLK
ncbi:unnamed protein product [Didymodactylos carnosus]|uniref:Tectonic-1-3 N-terminal domain-containing protein n=1 Tax=Didymodactylos carnosus TaxID=1234261 RepID=A0A813WEA5_9BILA|nr:unnamed protein product [Didymodactylos carnosus]CAF0850077.1 unnamed protein product [Didymodactylos carnosus]CAF3634037.1 unnamed protein product [Didymodactylos carnosus]CAF3637689.1 unnamed protein product [Didymodactylos carnosus]